ncbi:CaiB/BaiF CoA transferase family protein [Nonomuraea rhizosphaerae]|uniref:CaiB/BaiF CoA transferase family protein n=1 Tax=Nonomuraea rhizosphaerae TaxID=2665663 RepID=UPI001C5FE7DD|nr:CoA transferase [Nonomuraea rhizosphaerae]
MINPDGALRGIRVVDFGHHVAGPLAAVMLADQGADVVHVDRPGVEAPVEDAFFNRGKRRITLDLKDARDLEVARGLVRRADVLIENFRPGVMDRLGLGWADLREANPRLVYCSMPGFAADDPRAGVPGWEGVIAAATGNCRIRAGHAPDGWDATRPTYTAIPVASNFAAFCGAFAIVAGLTARHRSGLGDRIEVPLYDAMFEAIGGSGAYPVERGLLPERAISSNGSGTYRCADGRYVQFNPIGATTRFLTWFLDAAGVTAWAGEGLTDRPRMDREPELRLLLQERLTALFGTRPAAEWEDLANAAGVPLAAVRTTDEWMENEHALAAGQVVVVEDPLLGTTVMPGSAVSLSATPSLPGRPRHLPDADRADILADLDAPLPQESPLLQRSPAEAAGGLPYDGLRVVDLTQILAGPSAGRILVEFGADVVKINSPQRRVGAHGFVNRGKRTVLVDVKSGEGQRILWRLIDEADVLTHNFPEHTAERYGLGYEHVRARRPDIVYVSVSCYGPGGPWASRRGYETQGQAATGIMARTGGDGRPAVLGPYNLLDYGTGTMAAFAAALGLYHREVSGEGQHVRTSLTQTGIYQQARYAVRAGSDAPAEPRGPAALGVDPWHRFYRAADRWFFLGASRDQLPALREIPALKQALSEGDPPDALEVASRDGGEGALEVAFRAGGEDALEAVFATAGADEWVETLTAAGVGAHAVTPLAELMTDPYVRSRGLAVSQVSEEVGEVVMPGIAIRVHHNPPRLGHPVRRPGADAREVLARIGLADSAEALERAWAVQLSALPGGWDHF